MMATGYKSRRSLDILQRSLRKVVLNAALLAISLLCVVPHGHGQDFEGHVIGVRDANTVEVLHGTEVIVLRLHGVDAPDLGQPFGSQAQAFVASLVVDKQAQIVITKPGTPGVLPAGQVLLASGFNLSHELLKAGLAWWDRNAAPTDYSLWKLEREARLEHRGLWADADPIPPWEWRRGF
jgi:micrococcal nuclease